MIRKHLIRNPLKPTAQGRHGFTLLELMISLFVFTVGILGVAVLQSQTVSNHTYSEHASQNNAVATDQIEEFMAIDYLDNRIRNNGPSGPLLADQDNSVTINYTVTNDNAIQNAKLVSLQAVYTGGTNGGWPAPNINVNIIKPLVK